MLTRSTPDYYPTMTLHVNATPSPSTTVKNAMSKCIFNATTVILAIAVLRSLITTVSSSTTVLVKKIIIIFLGYF